MIRTRENEPLRVVVIDDEDVLRTCLCRAMQSRGWCAVGAETAAAGPSLIKFSLPDLVLLDLRMPGMSGLDAIPHLLQLATQAYIVMLTGQGSNALAAEALKRGARDYLTKPVDADQIQAAYERIVLRAP